MGNVLKKENLTIVIGTYKDRQTGQEKKQYRTIGELITMQGDDGSTYQFGKLWGPTGCTDFKVFENDGAKNAIAAAGAPGQGLQYTQPPQQNFNSPQNFNQGGPNL